MQVWGPPTCLLWQNTEFALQTYYRYVEIGVHETFAIANLMLISKILAADRPWLQTQKLV